MRARWSITPLLSAAALAALALSICPKLLAADKFEEQLRDQYKGKTFILRDFPEGGRLAYDSNGVLATTAKTGDWTVGGVVHLKDLKIGQGRLTVNASRIAYEATDHGFQAESNGGVRITIDLGLERPSFDQIEVLISKIFLTSHDDFAETVQDIWKPCVAAGLMVKTPKKYAACAFPHDFLKIPGVIQQPEDRSKPEELPPSIAKSVSGKVLYPSKDITPPRKISGDEPEFTEEARRARYNGKVTLGLIIDKTGGVEKIWIISPSSYGLTFAALEAVSKWKFHPSTKEGQPVAVQVEIETGFHLYSDRDAPAFRPRSAS